ncbi:MAG: Ig-like domain-containing protein [Spirochaetaceae bacterium]|jgi:hypothetical protein|nr:Ig-like domain-containing protein [Spirochaetaceae bacterium]
MIEIMNVKLNKCLNKLEDVVMKKQTLTLGPALLAGFLALGTMLSSCLNPVGLPIEFKLSTEVSGQIDIKSVDYAILWVINHTNSVDVEQMTISREDGPDAYPTQVIDNRPLHASSYASYHQPSVKEYTVQIDYVPNPDRLPMPVYTEAQLNGTITTKLQMPRAGATYTLHLYRAAGDKLVLVENELMSKTPDSEDTEYPPEPPTEAEAVPLIIKNLTKNVTISAEQFGDLGFVVPVNAKDQGLFFLEPGSWPTTLEWIRDAVEGETPERNIITIANQSNAQRTLYAYFYRTTAGANSYDLTTTWPPEAGDVASDNENPEDSLGEYEGMLRIINKSTKWWIEETNWNDATYTTQVPGGNEAQYIVATGSSKSLQFTVSDGNEWKLSRVYKTTVNPRKVTTVTFDDSWVTEGGVDIPLDGGIIRLINDCTVNSEVTIQSLVVSTGSTMRTIGSLEFDPAGAVSSNAATGGNNYSANVTLIDDPQGLRITNGARYTAELLLSTREGVIRASWSNLILYRKAVTLVVTDAVIESLKTHSGTIRITNNSNALVTGILIKDVTTGNEAGAESLSFVPAGDIEGSSTAAYTFYGTDSVPLISGRRYSISVVVERDDNTRVVLVPGGDETTGGVSRLLYDRTIDLVIKQEHVDEVLPPPASFIPVTSIINLPAQMRIDDVLTLRGTSLETTATGYIVPSNATNRSNGIVLSKGAESNTNVVTLGGSTTEATITANTFGYVTVWMTVRDGRGPGQDYTQFVQVNVLADDQPPMGHVDVTHIHGIPTTLPAGTHTLQPVVQPTDATNKDITWSLVSGNATITSGGTLTANNSGTITIRATITSGIADGVDFVRDFNISITGGLVTVRFLYDGKTPATSTEHGWTIDAIEVIRRPDAFNQGGSPGPVGVLRHANDLLGQTDTWWTAHERGDSASSGTGVFHIGSTLPIEYDTETQNYAVLRIASPQHGQQVRTLSNTHLNSSYYNPAGLADTAAHYPGNHVWDSAYGSIGTWSGSGNGQALARQGDYATVTLRDDTVYWVRARMRKNDDAVGVWYKATSLQEWFSINLRTQWHRIDQNGVLNVYIYMFHLPYFDFSKQKAGTH